MTYITDNIGSNSSFDRVLQNIMPYNISYLFIIFLSIYLYIGIL